MRSAVRRWKRSRSQARPCRGHGRPSAFSLKSESERRTPGQRGAGGTSRGERGSALLLTVAERACGGVPPVWSGGDVLPRTPGRRPQLTARLFLLVVSGVLAKVGPEVVQIRTMASPRQYGGIGSPWAELSRAIVDRM